MQAKKIDINNRNLSRRHNGGSISSDSSVERRLNRLRIRADPQKDPDTTTTKPPKAQGSNSINPNQNPVSNGKMMTDKSSVWNSIIVDYAKFLAVPVTLLWIYILFIINFLDDIYNTVSDTNDASAQPTVVTDSSPPLVAGIAAFGCSYTVIDTFVPTLPDELDIQLGDKVTVLVVYDDGWVQGVNETQGGVKGVFPQHCVNMKVSFNVNNKRSSSM
ncbi:12407_t:CDS:2, partial [Gigaspora margarita]